MSNVDNSVIPFHFMFEDSSKLSQSQKEQVSHKNKDKESNLDFTQSEFTQNSSNNFLFNLFNSDEQQTQNETLLLSQDEKDKQNMNNCALETVLDKINEQQDEILQNDQEKNPFNINCFNQLNKNENFKKSISFEQKAQDNAILKQFEVASNAQLHQSICHNQFSKKCLQNRFPILPKEVEISKESQIGETLLNQTNKEQQDKFEAIKDEIKIKEIKPQQKEKKELKTLAQLKAERAQQPKSGEEKIIKKGIRLVDDKQALKKSLTEKRKQQLKANLKLDTLKQQHCRQSEHQKQMETKPMGQTSWHPLSMDKKAQSSAQLNLPVMKIEEKIEEKCKLPPKQNRLEPKKNIPRAQNQTIQLVHNIINIEKISIKQENPEQETKEKKETIKLIEQEEPKQIEKIKEIQDKQFLSNTDKNLQEQEENQENENILSARSQLQMKSNQSIPQIQVQPSLIRNQQQEQQQLQQQQYTNAMINSQNPKDQTQLSIPQQASINSLMDKYKTKRQNSTTNFRTSNDRFISQNIVKSIITKENKPEITTENKKSIIVSQDTKPKHQILGASTLNCQPQKIVEQINIQDKQNQKLKIVQKEEYNQENQSDASILKQQPSQILKIVENENNSTQKDLNYYRNKYKRNNSSQPEQTPARPKHYQQFEQIPPQSASKGNFQIEKKTTTEEILANIERNSRKQFLNCKFYNQSSEKFQVKTYEEMVSELTFKKQRYSRISTNVNIFINLYYFPIVTNQILIMNQLNQLTFFFIEKNQRLFQILFKQFYLLFFKFTIFLQINFIHYSMGICMKSNNIVTPDQKEQKKLIKSATQSQEEKNKHDNQIEEEVVHSQLKQSEIKSSQLMVPDQSNYSQSAEIKKVPTEKSFILASEQGDDRSPTQEISDLKDNNQNKNNLEAQWSEMQKKILIEGPNNNNINNNFEGSEYSNNLQDIESFNEKLIKEQEEEDD